MRGVAVVVAGLGLGLAACGGPAPLSAAPATPERPVPVAPSGSTAPGIAPSASPTFCPGRTWPPYTAGAPGGVAARSVDRGTIEITNRTGQTVHYRVSGWEPGQFETCTALGEIEVVRGPLAPGATERVMVDPAWEQADVPVTVALWDRACGEACAAEPLGLIVVQLSPVEPPAS